MKDVIFCLLILFAAFLLCACGTEPPTTTAQPTGTVTQPTPETTMPFAPGRYIYWNREDAGETETPEDVGAGQLYIRDELRRAMEEFADETDAVFAVTVLELTGASRQEVYDRYISKLDVVHDEYLLRQVIFVNRQQLEAMEPHENFAIVLKLRGGNNNCEIYLKRLLMTSYSEEDVRAIMENEIWGDPVWGRIDVAGDNGPYQEGESWESKVAPIVQDILEDYDLEKESLWLGTRSGQKWVFFEIPEEKLLDLWKDERIQFLIIEDWGGEFYAAEELECRCIDGLFD